MSDTLYENYNTGYDSDYSTYGVNWAAQSFTPSTTHNITSVKLYLFRSGNPGTATISIRATDGSGFPTGADLTSGTTNANTLQQYTPEWREIILSPYSLSAGTKYAIVFRVPSGDSSNYLAYGCDVSSASYSGGVLLWDNGDSGTTWGEADPTYDAEFEEYGLSIGSETSGLLAVVGETLHYVSKAGVEYVVRGVAV